jgi:hypothetical protein
MSRMLSRTGSNQMWPSSATEPAAVEFVKFVVFSGETPPSGSHGDSLARLDAARLCLAHIEQTHREGPTQGIFSRTKEFSGACREARINRR